MEQNEIDAIGKYIHTHACTDCGHGLGTGDPCQNGLDTKIFNEILKRLPLVHHTDPAQLYLKIRDAISNGIEAAIKAQECQEEESHD